MSQIFHHLLLEEKITIGDTASSSGQTIYFVKIFHQVKKFFDFTEWIIFSIHWRLLVHVIRNHSTGINWANFTHVTTHITVHR